MPRFAILEHHYQGVHWDFMLDTGAALRTWRLEKSPENSGETVATALPDHRRIYLDYEGEISGGRGNVVRWDAGEFEWIVDKPDRIAVTLRGARVHGRVHLTKSESETWSFKLTPVEADPDESAVS